MAKMLKYYDDAKSAIERGAEKLNDAVKITLGPKGRNVILAKSYSSPLITNDGVTIAKEIELEDEFENAGVEIIKEVAIKTNESAGDGTTTATILACTMIKSGLKYIRNSANPIMLKKGIEKATKFAVEEITNMSTNIKGKEDIARVASISASDEQIGQIISEAMEKVTPHGVITVEESNGMNTELEIVRGTKIDRGYLSAYMVTDMDKMEAVLDEPYILVTDKKISTIQEILPLLEMLVSNGKKLFIIADDIEKEVLSTLVVNKMRGIFTAVAIKAPSFGDRRKDMLSDIATITGATYISDELGISLKDVTLDMLGSAKQIRVGKESSVIVDGISDKEKLDQKIRGLKKLLASEMDEYEKEKLKERLSKLSEGVAVIRVGCATEAEMKEKKLRIEDALAGAEAAAEEGIVAGGGITYLRVKEKIKKQCEELIGDEKLGAKIVIEALGAPIKQILENAGKEPFVIIEKIKEMNEGIGYDALNSSFVNMKEVGIIDPAKVTRCALQNAASIASIVLTTEVICVEKQSSETSPKEII